MKTSLHWKKIGQKPHHGFCLPLSALRTRKSCGIGEFFDLLPLIDWCQHIGFDCLQLLPLNDTGSDPSPYNPLSSCALDPIYLSELADPQTFAPLTEAPRLERATVKQKKLQLLKARFAQTFPALSKTDAYQAFLQENSWLNSYAHFMSMKEAHGGHHWIHWDLTLSPDPSSLNFHRFVQYLCFSQLRQVHTYAQSRGVFLKGDLPILISPDSADVWSEKNLFNLHFTAGAPPDAYNTQGQNWGFPLFDWKAMEQDQYRWWKRRLKTMETYVDLYRIDHAVGLFRIWAIPLGQKPSEGAFDPPDPSLWPDLGKAHLAMLIDTTTMLPLAEDLGTIPEPVYPILKNLGICGTKVVRWQKNRDGYLPYDQYEPFSLTTLSTADMDLLTTWWKRTPEESVPFAHFKRWPYHPILAPSQHLELLRDAHHTPSYFHINLLQEYLTLFPELSWPTPEEERINIPGTLLPTNWTYRFRPLLEEITSHPGLASALKDIIGTDSSLGSHGAIPQGTWRP